MLKPLALAAALTLAGCAGLAVTGGGDVARLETDLRTCYRETFAFTLIPDLGFTSDYQHAKCMKQRGWFRNLAAGINHWVWSGPGSIKQLYRLSAEMEVIEHACPRGRQCQPVTESTEPTALVAWAFVADPDSAARRLDVPIVGDAVGCEQGRQRVVQAGLSASSACTGPRYFKREGAPDAVPVAATTPLVPTTPPITWATGD